MLAISKIIGFENSKTPHNGFKVVLNDINSAFRTCFFLRFRPKIDRFLVVSCDVLKQCEESVTIIDGECARFARNIHCKIFIILAYSQYRRYKYSSCTPPGCYEICCYLFSEGTLMRPPVIAEVSPPGNMYNMNCCVCLLHILGRDMHSIADFPLLL